MALTPINGLTPAQGLTSVSPLSPATKGGNGFEKMFDSLNREMTSLDQQAGDEIAKLAAGKADNVHQVMLALGKSEITFNYMLEVRNRLVDAYKEVSRMPL